jgi:hypothetical protein
MKGFIYIIRSHQTDDVYYGSTTQMLCKRMASHRGNYKLWLNEKYRHNRSFDILKFDDAYIELVEEIEFQNKQELSAREGHYIRENNCVNKRIEGRTTQQYYLDNKDKIDEQTKLYNNTHKIERSIYNKEWKEANKDKIKEQTKLYLEENQDKIKEQAKQYRESNKELIKERHKLWREANKDKIRENQRKYRASKKVSPE